MGCIKHIDALAVHDDGTGPALYIGGDLFVRDVGNNILKWDGDEVVQVGSRIENVKCGGVFDLQELDLGFGPRLYAAGSLWIEGDRAVALAEWDGVAWIGLGTTNRNQGIFTEYLEVFDDARGAGPALYAAGNYDEFNNQPAHNILRWGWPDLQLTVDPLIAGQDATLTATCARANEKVYFIASLKGTGQRMVPRLNITIDLLQPKLIATLRADTNGQASFTGPVFKHLAGQTIYLQAAQVESISRVNKQVVQ